MNIEIGAKVIFAIEYHELTMFMYKRFKFPVLGEEYTVRDLFIDERGVTCIRLREIINTVEHFDDGTAELSFDLRNFTTPTKQKFSNPKKQPSCINYTPQPVSVSA